MKSGRRSLRHRLVALAALWTLAPVAAFAQSAGQRRLFGGDAQPGHRPEADLTVSLSSGRDDDLGADLGTGLSHGLAPIAGRYSVLDTSLSVLRQRRTVAFGIHAASTGRYYPTLDSFLGSSHSVAADVTVNAGRRTLIRTTVDGEFVSSLAFDTLSRRTLDELSPQGGSAPNSGTLGIEASSLGSAWTSYGAAAALDRFVGKHASLSVTGGVRSSQRTLTGERVDEHQVAAQFERAVGRTALVRFGYSIRQGTERLGQFDTPILNHEAQVSVQREWRHSAVRRTAVTVSGGPSLNLQRTPVGTTLEQTTEQTAPSPDPTAEPNRELRAVGMVALLHDISRSWTARASYRRGSGVKNAAEFSDIVSLDVRGTVGRRLGLAFAGGYNASDIAVTQLRTRNEILFGSARVQFACTRFVALYSQYMAYRYDFWSTSGNTVPSQLLDRRGLQVGVSTWMPLKRW